MSLPGAGQLARAGFPVRRRLAPAARTYVALTKPRIIELLLVTTIPAMILAAHRLPSPALSAATLAGGALAAGGANAVNCYLDRDIDALMRRTRRRPLASRDRGLVSPGQALAFGVGLGTGGIALLGFAVNWLAATLAAVAFLFYVFVYTVALKRRTPANIVVGGAAGCFPVLVGWAAVTGTVTLPAVALAAVVFFWTPPHFWSLAMKFRGDYAAARVPMLPVIAAPSVVGRKILSYSYAMVAASLTVSPFAGWPYAGCAAVLGGWFLLEAHRLGAQIRLGGRVQPLRLFHVSIGYLALLCAAVAVSALV